VNVQQPCTSELLREASAGCKYVCACILSKNTDKNTCKSMLKIQDVKSTLF
jgi:hypothetical protein